MQEIAEAGTVREPAPNRDDRLVGDAGWVVVQHHDERLGVGGTQVGVEVAHVVHEQRFQAPAPQRRVVSPQRAEELERGLQRRVVDVAVVDRRHPGQGELQQRDEAEASDLAVDAW
jgi:hypothetical protein